MRPKLFSVIVSLVLSLLAFAPTFGSPIAQPNPNQPSSSHHPSASQPSSSHPSTHLSANRPSTCSISFYDVPPDNIFATYIYDLACNGVVNGIGGGYFGPSRPATRGQFARMVAVGFAVASYTPATPDFTDVPPTYFAYASIEALLHAGISSGYQQQGQCGPNGATAPCYLPNHNISRAEATALVMRAAGYTLIDPPNPSFVDVPTNYFAYQQIETARSLGIVSGLNGYFRPAAPIRRDELSRVLDLGINYLNGTPTPVPTVSLIIYDDALATGWDDWSWDTTRDFANTNPVYDGSYSLATTYTAAWGGLYLHHADVSLSPYLSLHFYINGGAAGGQNVGVSLADTNGNFLTQQSVTDYIADHVIPAGQWREVSIPLSSLGGPSDITGVTFQEASGGAQPVFYLDDISLTSAPPIPTVTPTPDSGPSPTPVPGDLTFYRGVNLSGGEFGSNVPGEYGVDYTYPTAAEFAYFKSKGLNFIRLPFLWERVQRSLNSPLDTTELGRLDTVIGYAQAQGMYVMLEPHNFDRYNIAGTDYLIGSPQVPDAAFADFWTRMAQHFGGDANVYYNLMNEPHDDGGHWATSAQAAVTAIRGVDMTHTIFIPGDGWQGAWTWMDNNASLNISDPANKLIYDAHQYFDADGSGEYAGTYDSNHAYPTIGVDRLQPFIGWLQAHNFKGFVSEYGIPRNDPRWLTVLDNFLGAMDSANLGGTYWSAGPWWGDYQLSVEPNADGSDKPQMPVLQRHLGKQQ